MSDWIKVKQAVKDGYILCPSGGVADLSYPTSTLRRGRVQGGGMVTATITTSPGLCKVWINDTGGVSARKLSCRELGRLQGVSDEDIDKMLSVNSESKCVYQFGNSICVPVLEAIFRNLNIKGIRTWEEENGDKQLRRDI